MNASENDQDRLNTLTTLAKRPMGAPFCGMHKLLPLILALAACKNPPPECAATGSPYDICANDAVWTCARGDSEDIAFNEAIDEACNETDDPIGCILDADYRMITMTLKEDCREAGQTCFEDPGGDPPVEPTCAE